LDPIALAVGGKPAIFSQSHYRLMTLSNALHCDSELISGSPHDYAFLIERWQNLAQLAELKMRVYGTAENFDLFYFHSPALESNGLTHLLSSP
jgi:hypothetical protein